MYTSETLIALNYKVLRAVKECFAVFTTSFKCALVHYGNCYFGLTHDLAFFLQFAIRFNLPTAVRRTGKLNENESQAK